MIKLGSRVMITDPEATGSSKAGIKAGEIYTVTKIYDIGTVQLDYHRFICGFYPGGMILADAASIVRSL